MGRLLDKESIEIAFNYYQEGESHRIRARAHAALLYDDEYEVGHIARILKLPTDYILLVTKGVHYFGIETILFENEEELRKRIKEIEFEIDKRQFEFRWFKSLRKFIANIGGFFVGLFVFVISFFGRIFNSSSTNKVQSNVENKVTFEEGANNNFSFQFTTVVVDQEGNKKEIVEKEVTKNQQEIINLFTNVFESKRNFNTDDPTINYWLEKAKIAQGITDPLLRRKEFIFIAGMIAYYLVFHTTVKGGIWVIGLFGITIAISFRACDSDNIISPPIVENKDSIPLVIPSELEDLDENVRDSMMLILRNSYDSLYRNYFEEEANCFMLTAITEKQKKFIKSFDVVDHENEEYFAASSDERVYLHVVSYEDIRYAAFQRLFLIEESGFPETKIFENHAGNKILYGVSIEDYEIEEIGEICNRLDDWTEYCFNGEVV